MITGVLVLSGCGKTVAGVADPVAGAVISSPSAPASVQSAPGGVTSQSLAAPSLASSSAPSPSASPSSTTISRPSTATTEPNPTTTSTTAPKTTPTRATPTPAPPAIRWLLPAQSKAKAKVNSFGNLVAGLGQPYEVTWTKEKTTALRFIVDSATVNGRCETPTKPLNGHFLILGVRVQLGDATADDLGNSGIGFTGDHWTAFDAKNVAEVGITSSAAEECITSESGFPYSDDLTPGRVISGKIALDVSSTKGTVVLMDSVDGGWIYNYG